MSGEITQLFVALEQLKKLLGDAIDKANDATGFADEIGGEFEQELSTDLDEIQTTL